MNLEEHPLQSERRLRRRVELHWPLCIFKRQTGLRLPSTTTQNLSSSGLCCVLEEPLSVGEEVICVVGLPPRQDPRATGALRCQAAVVWMRERDDGRYFVGCRIKDYTVTQDGAVNS